MDPAAIWWPLLLSTLAGLSTTIGGLIAVSFAPSEGTLAFLLGTAIGVMATVSGVELWWHSAAEQHDILGITAAVAAGAVLFAVLDPLLPKHEEGHMDSKQETAAVAGAQERHVAVRIDPFSSSNNGSNSSSAMQQTPAACSSSSSCEAQLIDTTLLQGATSNGTSRPSTTGSSNGSNSISSGSSSRPSSSNNIQQQVTQQLAVLAHGQSSQVPGADNDDVAAAAAAAAAVDPQMERLPLLSASNSSSSGSKDEFHRGHSYSSIGRDAAVGSLKLAAVSNTAQQTDNGISHQQQQQQQDQQQQGQQQQQQQQQADEVQRLRQHHAGMLRLGLLMTITLTIHNLPEGFAVAFSAFTNIGPIMALAIALHNIPEGLVIAAPLYAATGSKLTALGATAASGLSEPVGALLALLVFKPFVTSLAQLGYVLAATGGVMLAVCVLELWPEGRRCGQDGRLWQGIALGTVVMGWTLYVGV
uniref:ZIP family transporter n=1 Tax=Tetradesmus obliquus TaxID=3088 RepID=A0A383WPF5_TETOB